MDISHRLSKARIRVLGRDGKPVSSAGVCVRQTSQDFLFGCGAFEAVKMYEDPERFSVHKDRVDKWLKIFNYGTIPFYWGRYEPVEGQPRQELNMKAADFLQSHGVRIKGHPLCWHTVCADWLLKYDDETIFRKQLERIKRDVGAFAGKVDMWDVINEVVIMPVFDKYDNAVTRICNLKGQVGLVKAVFDAARSVNPSATLLINDFNTSPQYKELLDRLLDAGVPISAIGIQSHQHQGYWGVEKIQEVLDRFSVFGIPLHFTENTLISGDLMPGYIEDLNDWVVDKWPSTPEGEIRQAEQMKEMYETLYSHPLVQAITTWDFTDECWLNAPAGLLRLDNSEKPSYGMLRDLIHKEWSTNIDLVTDAEGYICFEGFRGTYQLISSLGSSPLPLHGDTETTVHLA